MKRQWLREALADAYVRSECERIRSSWSPRERAKRRAMRADRVLSREVAVSDVVGAGR
jgi:hypothetical protein